jgi:hypothetical protein
MRPIQATTRCDRSHESSVLNGTDILGGQIKPFAALPVLFITWVTRIRE